MMNTDTRQVENVRNPSKVTCQSAVSYRFDCLSEELLTILNRCENLAAISDLTPGIVVEFSRHISARFGQEEDST